MDPQTIRVDSLVIYKQKPALVRKKTDKKISILTVDGSTISVRPKDILFLHPGPVTDFSNLVSLKGDVVTAWEILAGEKSSLEELADLIYGQYSASAALAVWKLIEDGLYFSGSPAEITVQSAEEVAAEKSAREAKAAEQLAWTTFLERINHGIVEPEDDHYLQDVIDLAEGRRDSSRVLQDLGQAETAENAHAFLLNAGVWSETINPYPLRAGLPITSSDASLGSLPDQSRRDLTHLLAFAIDDAGSEDPDDALSWEDGRIWVHIADAAALIRPNSPADIEARARGANLYLPEGTVSMLPPGATQLLALGLKDISPALSFGFSVSHDGHLSDLEIVPSWVRVTRLSYESAVANLEDYPFKQLLEAAEIYQDRRQKNGAINIDLPEVKLRVVEGQVVITSLPELKSRDLVREAMLMTGEAVAIYATEHNIPIPFTTQDAPTDEIPEGHTPSVMFATRKLLKPSQKSRIPGKHHGLGMDYYVQATSPLRRYLDLIVHQQLRAFTNNGEIMSEQDITNLIGASDAASRDVRFVERKSNRHWTCVYLMQHRDWSGDGIVVEIRGKRHTVLIPQIDLETSIYRSRELPLDSSVKLSLNDVDLVNLEPSFRVLSP